MRIKKIIALIIALMIGVGCLAACSDKEDTPDSDSQETVDTSENTENTESTDNNGEENNDKENNDKETLTPQMFKITSATPGVKVLGVRNLASENGLHMDWSCSGAEFAIDLKGGSVRLNFKASSNCYIRVWVDGNEYKQNGSEYFTVSNLSGSIVLNDIPAGKHTIRVMKVTGYTLARAELTGVMFAGSMLTDVVDTADKDTYIEFVGDSITCGWGTIGEHTGAYTDQDGTYAYSYLLAKELDVDYSMTALSGQGLLCGNPGVTNGYLYADPIGNGETKYDFARKADIVVINIGTNDYSNKNVSEADFIVAYLNFLRTIREKNGNECKILCLYNTMNDTYANAILAAVENFGGTFAGVTTYKLNRAEGNHHPNIAEHEAYAEALKDIITSLPEKSDSGITYVPEGDGSSDSMDFGQLNKG